MNVHPVNNYPNLSIFKTNYAQKASADAVTDMNGDSVAISSEAKKLDIANLTEDANRDGTITLNEIKAALAENLDIVQGILQKTVQSMHISPAINFQVDIDAGNNVVVSGGSEEENAAMAATLQQDGRFHNAWAASSNHATMLALAGPTEQFQKAYQLNPEAAAAQFSWLFNKNWDFDLHFHHGRVSYSTD